MNVCLLIMVSVDSLLLFIFEISYEKSSIDVSLGNKKDIGVECYVSTFILDFICLIYFSFNLFYFFTYFCQYVSMQILLTSYFQMLLFILLFSFLFFLFNLFLFNL